MSNLTRIKNNQVTDSTIVASAKLVPGSITGGLFSDPISYSGSMTIVGNLTVQGTTTTVDTTNTLVADPIIVLSRGETGSPSNDSGFLVERGTSDNAAFLWDETNDRFEAITTTADGLSGGSVTVADYADIKMRDAILTGGDITSTVSTVNVFNATATTVNFAGAATTLEIGAATGTTNINNDLDVDGNINMDGGSITTTAGTVNIANANSTTVNFAGAATTLEIGAATGTTNINNNLDVDGNINMDSGSFTTTAATVNIANANTTTLNLGGAATAINIGAATGASTFNHSVVIAGNLTVQGVTTTVDSVTTQVVDPIMTIGGGAGGIAPVSDDNKDRGIAFQWHNGSSAKTGFFGYDDSAAAFTFVPDATISSEVVSGSTGTVLIDTLKTANITSATTNGNVTISPNGTGNIVLNSVTITDVAANRIPYSNASGIIDDTSNLTFDGSQMVVTGTFVANGLTLLDNLTVDGSTISAAITNGGIGLEANGTGDIVVNGSGINTEFYVYGNTSVSANPIIYTSPTTAQLGILTDTPTANAAVHINATSSILVPVGTTGQRPGSGTETAGMMRFNSSTTFLEFYDGSTWQSTSGSFTVINYQNFLGDGSTVGFTLSASSTTAATLIAINGVLQQPTTAYTVSGTSLTFTEAPLSGDDIDVRLMTTTTTVVSLAEGDSSLTVADVGTGQLTMTLDGTVRWLATGNTIRPNANNTVSLGTASYQWANVNAVAININGVPAASTDDATALAIALG